MGNESICLVFDLMRYTAKSMSLKSGNEMISANDRLNFHIRAELVAHLRQLGNVEARQYVGDLKKGSFLFSKQKPCHVIVQVCAPSKRHMDTPNWYPTIKPLIDGLTDMGMFEDDNDEIITSITFMPGPKSGTKKYRFILEIREGRIFEREIRSREDGENA